MLVQSALDKTQALAHMLYLKYSVTLIIQNKFLVKVEFCVKESKERIVPHKESLH